MSNNSLVFRLQLQQGIVLADEELDDWLVVEVCGVVYRCPPFGIRGKDVGVVGQQARTGIIGATPSRQVKRGRAWMNVPNAPETMQKRGRGEEGRRLELG